MTQELYVYSYFNYCFEGTLEEGLLWGIFVINFIWIVLWGYSILKCEVFLSYLSLSTWFDMFIIWYIQNMTKDYKPNTSCTDSYGLPSYDTSLLFAFIGVIIMYGILEKYWLGWYHSIILFGCAVYQPIVLWYTGNNYWHQIILGIAFGLASGVFKVIFYKYIIFEPIDKLLDTSWVKFFGYKDTYMHGKNTMEKKIQRKKKFVIDI